MKYTKRIGIDCRLAGKKHAGIGRYTQNLIIRLPKIAEHIEWVYFFYDKKQLREMKVKKYKNVETHIVPIQHYSIQEQTALPKMFQSHNLDLLHVPHFNLPILYKGEVVTTIHDLLWHEYRGVNVTTLPKWKYILKYIGYRYIVSQAVKKSVKILVPANTIKQTLVSYYPHIEDKIEITKEGVEEEFKTKILPTKKKRFQDLLYVGSLYPHKNIHLVINALEILEDYQLKIIGSRNVFQEQVKRYVKNKKVHNRIEFLGYVPDKEIKKLYQSSFALVQPSLFEGFGLTGVEAMAAGCPVLASDIPIFHEIYKNAATFFHPKSVDSFVQAVYALENTKTQKEKIRNGISVVQEYSWDAMAQKTFAVYKEVIQKN